MTGAKRPQPLRQIHPDPTCAHGLHMHYFYHFDTATDLYLSDRKDTPTRLYARTSNTRKYT